jgi:transposase
MMGLRRRCRRCFVSIRSAAQPSCSDRNERTWIKILVWDRTGLVLVHKRLEGCKFVWPKIADGVMRMSPAMFAALFEGLDWRLVRPEEARRPQASG